MLAINDVFQMDEDKKRLGQGVRHHVAGRRIERIRLFSQTLLLLVRKKEDGPCCHVEAGNYF